MNILDTAPPIFLLWLRPCGVLYYHKNNTQTFPVEYTHETYLHVIETTIRSLGILIFTLENSQKLA